MERFSPGRLFEDQLEPPSSPIYWVLAALFAMALFGSLYVYLLSERRYANDRFLRRLVHRYAALIGSFSGLGLAACVFSLLATPFLSKRLWLVVATGGLLGTAGYLGYYLRRGYPAQRAAYLDRERRKRSLPRPKASSRKRRARRR